MARFEQRLAQLERDARHGATRFFMVKTSEDSAEVEDNGRVFPDLDSWKRAVGFQDSDHLTVIVYVRDWR